jgi:hypothetical protein
MTEETNAVVPLKAQMPSTQPSRLVSISENLDRFDAVKDRDGALVPAEDCKDLIRAIEADSAPVGPEGASRAARAISAVHPRNDVDNPAAYHAAITAILADYPAGVVARASDPRVGIVRKVKFLPRPAEVAEFCDAEMARRRNLRAKALYVLKLHEERAGEARRAAKPPVDYEARRKQVEALLAGFDSPN